MIARYKVTYKLYHCMYLPWPDATDVLENVVITTNYGITMTVRVLALTAFLCLSSGVAPDLQDDADCPAGCFCDKRRGDHSLLNKQVLFSFLSNTFTNPF